MKKCKKNKKPQSTMTFHLWCDFVMFAIIILGALWVLQVIFLNTFYESMKRDEIEKIGDRLTSYYVSDYEKFEDYSRNRDVFAVLLSEDGYVLSAPQFMEVPHDEFDRHPRPKPSEKKSIAAFNPERWEQFVDKVEKSEDKKVTYVVADRRNSRTMIYGAGLAGTDGERVYLYISSLLDPIDATRQVLQTQLIIVSVLSLLASLVLAYFIARRFSSPIVRISESAKKFGSGKYDVRFEEDGYREISDLAGVLNTAAGQLEKTDELRRDLIANVSHDLKTPLTIIKSYAEMIRDISGDNKEKRTAHTQVIIDEANRLSLLVNDILDLSKLESGIAMPDLKAFSASDAVNNIIKHFCDYTQHEGYTISADVDDNLYVLGDEIQINQVIYNLITNAINYSGEVKKADISLKKLNGIIRFEVKDSGEGIEEDELAYVWDRYYRSGRNHKRDIAGTGIGLSIVKNILEVHGARYGVESVIGEGCVFWFEMDAYDSHNQR